MPAAANDVSKLFGRLQAVAHSYSLLALLAFIVRILRKGIGSCGVFWGHSIPMADLTGTGRKTVLRGKSGIGRILASIRKLRAPSSRRTTSGGRRASAIVFTGKGSDPA